ncbi:hypothetical protein EDD22DRAFT_950294 [Suillus occidentalis]|nr:hypothetical protein EDD22DRAFT_950294 [Suillus occidentalis]
MPLPEDPCADSITHLQRLPQGAYMQHMQENQQILALHERCKSLELQIVKLTSERDTLRAMFQQLASGIRLPQTDSGLELDSITPPFQPITKRPTRLTHPCVQFWTNEDFTAWLDSPDGLRANRGKVPYLEDENGDPLTDTIIKSIRKLLRGAWAELIRRKLAPKTWGKADDDEESSGCSSNAKGKKRKQSKSLKSVVPEKKMKVDPIREHMLLSPSPSLAPSRAPSPTLPLASLSPTTLPLKSLNLQDEPSPTAASLETIPLLVLTRSTSVAVPMEKENIPPSPQPTIKIKMTNPLSTLALAAVGTMIPPLPPSIDPPPTLSAPCSTAMKVPGKAAQTKNGLCSISWLKQVASNKTTEEFCVYYGDLSADQRKKYDTEAGELVANNAWNKKAYEGTLH